MSYIKATIAEIKLELQYRMWASMNNKLESYDNFGEFIKDAKWYAREMIDGIKYSARHDY